MQEVHYRENGEVKKLVEMFNLPDDGKQESVLRRRYDEAIKKVFANGAELISIRQGKIGRNDPCPCGSGRKFKRCCESKLKVEIATGGH